MIKAFGVINLVVPVMLIVFLMLYMPLVVR